MYRLKNAKFGQGTSVAEIDPAVMAQRPEPETGAVWMELERPDGLRLRIRPSGGAEMLALVERFMGT